MKALNNNGLGHFLVYLKPPDPDNTTKSTSKFGTVSALL